MKPLHYLLIILRFRGFLLNAPNFFNTVKPTFPFFHLGGQKKVHHHVICIVYTGKRLRTINFDEVVNVE